MNLSSQSSLKQGNYYSHFLFIPGAFFFFCWLKLCAIVWWRVLLAGALAVIILLGVLSLRTFGRQSNHSDRFDGVSSLWIAFWSNKFYDRGAHIFTRHERVNNVDPHTRNLRANRGGAFFRRLPFFSRSILPWVWWTRLHPHLVTTIFLALLVDNYVGSILGELRRVCTWSLFILIQTKM